MKTDHKKSLVYALQNSVQDTPAFIYSAADIADQAKCLSNSLGTPILASASACCFQEVISRIIEPNVILGAKCSSRYEMNCVGGWKSKYLYLGMCTADDSSIRSAMGGRFKFIVDSPSQIEALLRLRGVRKLPTIILSLNQSFIEKQSNSLYGMDFCALTRALILIKRESIPVGGIRMHAGRYSFASSSQKIVRLFKKMTPYIERQLGYELQELNFGGGLEEDWWCHGHDFAAYRKLIMSSFRKELKLMHELGRSLFAAGGVFLTRVSVIKKVNKRTIAICDGGYTQAHGLTDMNRFWLDGKYHIMLRRKDRVSPLVPVRFDMSNQVDGTTICGSTGSVADILAYVTEPLHVGDILGFSGVGSYMQNAAPLKYLNFGYTPASTYVYS